MAKGAIMNNYNHKTRSCDQRKFCQGIIINGRCPQCGIEDSEPVKPAAGQGAVK